MSYTDDPENNPIDRIRLNVGDTDVNEEGLSDTVYSYLLGKHDDNENICSLEALKLLVAKYAKYADEKAGELEEKAHQKFNQYSDLLDKYTKDPTFSPLQSGLPYAGGISLTDRANNPSSNPFKLTNPLLNNCRRGW